MSSLDMSATISPLKMAETLYLSLGVEALATLEGKIATGGHLLNEQELQYATDVCHWLRSLVDAEVKI